MHLLIPHGRFSDRYLVQAAQEMGHYVHFMCNHQEDERMEKVDRACLPDRLVPLASRFKLKLSHEDYQVWYFETIYKYVMKYKIDAILPSSSMDSVMNEVAKVNEEFGLPGILPEQAEFFRDKTVECRRFYIS